MSYFVNMIDGVLGDTPLEGIVILSIVIFLYAILSGGRNAKVVAEEMYQMFKTNDSDLKRWQSLKNERTLQENLGVLWFIPGLFLAWILVVQLGLHLFVGLAALLFFDLLSITKPKSQEDYYADKFDNDNLRNWRVYRKNIWQGGHLILTAGIVFFLFVIYSWIQGII